MIALHRVSFRSVPDNSLKSPVIAVWSRLVITGGNHHRLHEELTLSGGELKGNGFSRITQLSRLDTIMDLSTEFKPSEFLFNERKRKSTVEARSRERLKHLENTLERRKSEEIKDVLTVLKT